MLRIEGLSKSYGGRRLLTGVDLQLRPDDRVGLVGRNGSGKTTLLRLVAGEEAADDGRVRLRKRARIGYLRQEVEAGSDRALIAEVRTAQEPILELERQLEAAEDEITMLGAQRRAVPSELASRYDALRHEFERAGGFKAEALLRGTLVGLGLAPAMWQQPLRSLSGGWLMRVELAKLLLARPEVLLLDEPTNHLDLPSIRWFEGVLAGYPGAVLVVSHDRTFLDRHATCIAEIEGDRLRSYRGNYSAYLRQKAARLEESGARRTNLDRQIAHMAKFVARFGAKASKARQAQSRRKTLEKLQAEREELESAVQQRSMRVRLENPARSGDLVLRLEEISKRYGEHCVYDSLDLEVRRGERIALVGPNGAGKSTLLRIAAGELDIDGGAREAGHNVTSAFYAQHQLDALQPHRTVLEELEADARTPDVPRLRGLLGAFLFSGDDVQKKVSVLSGGEAARLALAKLLLRRANFLVLDEPTNHLDIEARDVLMDALRDYSGTLLFVSHDRLFVNALANRVIEITPGERTARVRDFAGAYDEYIARIEAEEAGISAKPGRTTPAKGRRGRNAGRADRERARALRKLRERVSEIESVIETAEGEIEAIDWKSADPAIARDGEQMRGLQRARSAQQQSLEDLYREWEQISSEIEAAENELETEACS
jgi:ATP-binding cassette subfamily F protein 3